MLDYIKASIGKNQFIKLVKVEGIDEMEFSFYYTDNGADSIVITDNENLCNLLLEGYHGRLLSKFEYMDISSRGSYSIMGNHSLGDFSI